MKNVSIICLFLLFYSFWSIAQIPSKLKNYYSLVNSAEIAICDSNYSIAFEHYIKAFDLVEYPFAQDIYNASICSIMMRDFQSTLQLSQRLVLKGCELDFFHKFIYKEFRKDKKRWSLFTKNYPFLRKEFLKKYNKNLVISLKKMVEADQNYYCEAPKQLTNNIFSDSLFKNDSYLAKEMINIFKQHGYPTEELIGVNIIDTSIVFFPTFNVLIRHNYQKKRFDFTSYLEEAVHSGKLKSELFCNWYSFQKGGSGYGEQGLIEQFNCGFYLSKLSVTKEKININRISMSLPPIDDLIKKIIFYHCIKNRNFVLYAPIGIIPGYDKETEGTLQRFSIHLPYKAKECTPKNN